MKRLNTLLLVNESDKQIASFHLNDIVRVYYGKMKDFHTDSNIFATGHEKNERAIQICFTDGNIMTFGEKWHIEFEKF